MGRPKKYNTEEERKAARKEWNKRWREANAVKVKEYQKRWIAEYRNTPMGRAIHLVSCYKRNDKKYNRGECTLTPKWVVDNIFNKPCHYNCGETDWTKLGCDRIDNSKPHTPDNVVPCCEECNKKRGTMNYEEFLMSLSGIN